MGRCVDGDSPAPRLDEGRDECPEVCPSTVPSVCEQDNRAVAPIGRRQSLLHLQPGPSTQDLLIAMLGGLG